MNALAGGVLRNKRKATVLGAYAVATAAVVGGRWLAYAHAPSWFVPLARASAAGVYLNCALVLLPMLRLTLSRRWVASALRYALPLHQAIQAHAIAGTAILGFSAVHVVAYAGLWLSRPGGIAAVALWTGVALTVLCGALAAGVIARRARFEAFYYTHFLTIPIGVLLIVHAPRFLLLVGVPLGLYLGDRLVRVAWMTRAARLASVRVDGRDLDLVVERPRAFEHASGDYAFLCVPAVSRLQWHPFSLIGAPSDSGALAFRIRRAGAWTAALAEVRPGARVYVDGPFASPCRELHDVRRAVIVAAGIGITPFASWFAEVERSGTVPFDRVHLYWLERDVDSFRAFRSLLEGVAAGHEDWLTVTFVADQADDPLPAGFRRGPLDWDAELERVREDGMLGAPLFFCGPPPLSAMLRSATRRTGFLFRTECF